MFCYRKSSPNRTFSVFWVGALGALPIPPFFGCCSLQRALYSPKFIEIPPLIVGDAPHCVVRNIGVTFRDSRALGTLGHGCRQLAPSRQTGWILVVTGLVGVDCADQVGHTMEPQRSRLVVMSRKNLSTILSHEMFVGVKCTWIRGHRLSQACPGAWLCVSIVADDETQVLVRWCRDLRSFSSSWGRCCC